MQVKLTLPLPVSINALYMNEFRWDSRLRKRVPTGGRILTPEGQRVKKEIIEAATEQLKKQEWNYDMTEHIFVYIDSIIYFNRKGRDESNLTKLMNDSLEKIIYENDSRTLSRAQRIYYDKDNPRMEVTITPVEYVGIFDDKNEFEEFFQRCLTCKRLEKNCSIFIDSIEAVIRKEVVDKVCMKYAPKTKMKEG